MKQNFTLTGIVILFVFLFCSSAYADDYNVSSGNAINISTPGSYSITGSGSSPIYISSTVSGAVFNITLDNMTLSAASWASAINVQNSSSGSMTVNFIIVGTNSTTGYNHGGIQSIGGTVNVVFTTTSSGTLTSSAYYSDSFAFKNNGGTLLPSVDSNVTCTATLAGSSVSVSDALSGAFTQKPLVLTLSKTSTGIDNTNSSSDIKLSSLGNSTQITGLQEGESYQIYSMLGTCVINTQAKGTSENISLPRGIYVLKTNNAQVKFIR